MTVTPSSPKRQRSPRIELKIALQMERAVGRLRPICPVCNLPIIEAVEMHEVFLTKGDVQGAPKEVQELINCRENCVLLHPKCHLVAQFELRGSLACAHQLLLFNVYDRIFGWLTGSISTGLRIILFTSGW